MFDISVHSSSHQSQACITKSHNNGSIVDMTDSTASKFAKITLSPTKSNFFKKKLVITSPSLFKGLKRRACSSTTIRSSSSSTISLTNDDTESSVCSAGMNSIANGSCCSSGSSKRSCVKGTPSNNSNQKSSTSKKSDVRFGKKKFSKFTEVYIVPSFLEHADDLWWTRSELDRCRKQQIDFSESSQVTKNAVKTFLESYQVMRKEFYSSMSDTNGNIHFSSDQYYNIAKGYAYGFNGLEKLVGFDTELRRYRNKEVIQKIIEFHRLKKKLEDETAISNFSKALTSKDRYWARATGNAAGVAAH